MMSVRRTGFELVMKERPVSPLRVTNYIIMYIDKKREGEIFVR